jgi:hypothetical protein
MKNARLVTISLALLLLSATVSAAPMGYNVAWQGSKGYSLAGMFSYEDSGQRLVKAGDLTSFMIEGFRRGESIGSWSGNPGAFFYSAGSSHLNPFLQAWNLKGPGVGFGCLFIGCGLKNDSGIIWRSASFGGLSVTPKTAQAALPEPATLGLIFAGLAAFGLRRRLRS